MDELLVESLKEIKSFINRSVTLILSIMSISTISYVNNSFYLKPTPIKFLDVEIYPDYLSFILGCLYFGFFLFIYSKFHQLRLLIEELNQTNKDQNKALFDLIKHYSWVFSPIHKSRLSLLTFWGLIIFLLLHMLLLTITHLSYRPASLPLSEELEYLYQLVGWVIGILFFLSLIPLSFLFKDIFSLRKTLDLYIPQRIHKILHFSIISL